MSKYNCAVNTAPTSVSFSTKDCFAKTAGRKCQSAIDNYSANISEITKLLGSIKIEENTQIGNLILLGYVSAVESYFREIFRKVILIDNASERVCEEQTLTYGAAISHDKDLLPDALLENFTFISGKNIKHILKEFIGIQKQYPKEVESVLDEFTRTCQLRHCAVHRFSRMGSSNAITLGLYEHKEFIDKQLDLTTEHLDKIAAICTNTVKVINNYLFERLLERTCTEKTEDWKWDYDEDKKTFKQYFRIFHSKDSKTVIRTAYNKLKKIYDN